ncbi:MAG TPA: hypothetical protein VFA80_13655 [Xanthobacteraceae bacterium]|jgi:hypothetical protein|nr:hypothetical protein [Xanthobacteraceae bacterium]
MRHLAAALVACFCSISLAKAGPYTDDLSKCLVASTTSDDQVVFARWLFGVLSLHPGVGNLASITPDERAAIDKKAIDLYVRLMSVDCRQPLVSAIKYEGLGAIQTSFQLLGQVAMRGLMGDTKVAQGLKTLSLAVAQDQKLISLLREAGAPLPDK